jgi:hypothetical protein
MNRVVFLPESVQKKRNNKKNYIKWVIVFLMSNIILLLFFYLPYNNLVKLRKENRSLKQKYSITDDKKTKEYKTTKAYLKEQQLLETVNLIKNEKQMLGENLSIFRNINSENMCIETIQYNNNRIAIQGKAVNYFLIISLLKFINDSKLYAMVRLTSVGYLEQSKSFTFQIGIKLKSSGEN